MQRHLKCLNETSVDRQNHLNGHFVCSIALSSSRLLRVTTVATNPKCFIRWSTIDSANFHAHGLHALYNHWTNQTDFYKHFESLLKQDLKCDQVVRRDLLGLLTDLKNMAPLSLRDRILKKGATLTRTVRSRIWSVSSSSSRMQAKPSKQNAGSLRRPLASMQAAWMTSRGTSLIPLQPWTRLFHLCRASPEISLFQGSLKVMGQVIPSASFKDHISWTKVVLL